MSEAGEFDPSAAAGRATGRLADQGVDTSPTPPSNDSTDAGDVQNDDQDDKSDDKDSIGLTGAAAAYVVPLFTAPTRGPTASTFEDYDVTTPWARILDGVSDYVLALAGKDVGDSLGPVGKIGLGFSAFERNNDGSSDDGDGDAEGGVDHGDAPVIQGVSAT